MIDKEALEKLQQAAAINALNEQLYDALNNIPNKAVMVAPQDFKLHDLQKFLPTARSMRGRLKTRSLESFAAYVKANGSADTCRVFTDTEEMKAVAILDAGNIDAPGHCEHQATLTLDRTPACSAMHGNVDAGSLSQRQLAEFLEDWSGLWTAKNGEDLIDTASAIAAVRDLTIDAARKLEQKEESLSASRSAFESVTASSKHRLPSTILFTCDPHDGFEQRTFTLRLRVRLDGERARFALDLANPAVMEEAIGNEFAAKIAASLKPEDYLIVLGEFER